MSGQVRELVPFFIPGAEGNVVNETLQRYASLPTAFSPSASPTHSPRSTPAMRLNIRQWDDKEGFFRDSVQLIRDRGTSPSAISSFSHVTAEQPTVVKPTPTTTVPRLLTPAEIRLSRRRASTRQSTPQIVTLPAKAPLVSTPRQTKSSSPTKKSPQTTPRSRKTRASSYSPSTSSGSTTPAKEKLFAGSTFEAASPAPVSLPIPAFVRKSSPSPSQPLTTEAAMREQAAVDLRRILRI